MIGATWRPLPRFWGYLLAIVGVIVATGLQLALNRIAGANFPLATFLLAALITSWACGQGPSLLAVGLGAVTLWAYILPMDRPMGLPENAGLPGLLIYLSIGIIGIAVFESERRIRRRLETESTERRLAEEQLRESESRLRDMIELNPQLPWIAEPDGAISDFSQRWLDLTGLTRDQALGDGWVKVMHPGDSGPMLNAWTHSVRTGEPYDIEHRIRLADGSYHWVRSRSYARKDDAGQVIRWYGTTEDIHDHKLAEIELEESNRQFRELTEAIPQIAYMCDVQGKLIYVNRRWTEQTGLDLERSLIRSEMAAVIHPDDSPVMNERWAQSVASGRGFEVQFRLRRAADGSYGWFLARCVPVKDRHGRVVKWFGTFTDIDEQKRAEEKLRESEATLRAFYDNSPMNMGVVELIGDDIFHLYDNRATARFFGVDAGTTAGRLSSELGVSPEVTALWLSYYRECEATGTPVYFEYENRNSAGARWLAVTVSLIGQGPSGHNRLCYIAEDVTERRRLADQLEAERSLLDAFFASTTLALGIVDTQYRFLRVNEALAETNGVPVEEHLGRTLAEVLPDLWPTIGPLFRNVLETGEPLRNIEIDGKTSKVPEGLQSWLVNYYPVKQGEHIAGVGFAIAETTEARLREARLREAEERFRASQEASLYGFTILKSVRDDSGRIVDFEWVYINPAAASILNHPVEELIGARLLPVLPGNADSGLFARYIRVVETGEPHDIEIPYSADGFSGWLRNMAVRLGDGVAVSFSDITDRKRAEQELRDADRRKDEFLAMLAHELRNPLAPIRNAISVMAMAEDDLESQRWSREVVDRQVKHLTRLVDDLLDVSRINEGKITLSKAPLAVSAFVNAAIESSRPLIDAHRHRLDLVLCEETLRVEGDLTRLAQVVMNLLNNAAKYTPEGGEIRVTVERDGDQVVIGVHDNGEGLSSEMLPRVFDLFAQASRSLDRSQGGLGIGLTLVKRLVELHGGTVEVESEGPGRGCEFVVRLPLLEDAALTAEPSPPRRCQGQTPPRCRRILVVDDSPDSTATLARILGRLGHEVQTVDDGPSACEAALRFRPELVLLDIGLPGMDGYEVARRLRAEPSLDGLTLVALTGYGAESDRLRSVEAGFDAHLVKPIELDALEAIVHQIQCK